MADEIVNKDDKLQKSVSPEPQQEGGDDADFVLPIELRREIIDILNDNPTLQKIGNKEYKIYNLRAYAYNRILKTGLRLIEGDKEIKDDKKLMYAVCTDLDASSEIVAIILCNHLFNADSITDYKSAEYAMTHNDKLVETMKTKVLNSVFEPNQWAAIILEAMHSIDLSSLFIMLTLAKRSINSLTNVRTRTEEQLQSWQEAREVMQATSCAPSPNTP